MIVRQLMRKLIELDPDTRIGLNAHSGGCDIDIIGVREYKGAVSKVDWKATPSTRPDKCCPRDFVFKEDGEPIIVIST